MLWQIQYFPICTHHVFLSHCQEDRDWLALPLRETLRSEGIIPWLDLHDYPYGRTSFEALRDGVLKSRHTAFLVTSAMLDQPRGWTFVELAWADLLQENLREAGGVLHTVLFPLFFLDKNDLRMRRSAWFSVCDRAAFHRPADGNAVAWAARQIQSFVLREAQRGLDNATWLQQDSKARQRLGARQGLLERIKALHPALLPA